MGFRFQRRFTILPGVVLNFSKSGVSLSLGPRGAKYTLSTKGHRGTIGIPGTGMSYSKYKSHKDCAEDLNLEGGPSVIGRVLSIASKIVFVAFLCYFAFQFLYPQLQAFLAK